MPSSSTGMPGFVAICGTSAYASAVIAKIAPIVTSTSTAATLSICARSNAT